MLSWLSDQLDEITSYAIGGLGVLQSIPLDSVWSFLMGFGSFVLLAVRLYIDVPRAIKAWKERNNKEDDNEAL